MDIEKLAYGLQAFSDPNAMARYAQVLAARQSEEDRKRERDRQAAVMRIMQEAGGQSAVPTSPGVMGPQQPKPAMDNMTVLQRLAQADPQYVDEYINTIGGGGNGLPAALRLANEYESAIQSGNIDRANRIAAFSKIYDKNVMQTPDGQYVPLPGLPSALGQIKYGENMGGETATQQVRSAYEPGRAGDTEQKKLEQQLSYASKIKEEEGRGAVAATQYGTDVKNAANADKTLSMLATAEELLPVATGSGLGTARDAAYGFFGKSTNKTQANEQLKMLSGWLVANVPRMEGPQSNFDVENYKTMAANIGDSTKPIGDRLSSLQGLRALQSKYANMNTGQGAQSAPIMVMNPQTGEAYEIEEADLPAAMAEGFIRQ